MTACADKVAYLSEHLATNAATLHGFVHPACTDVEPYRCIPCSAEGGEVWHIGHQHIEAGQRCKSEPPVRPFIPRQPPRGSPARSTSRRKSN